MNHSTAVFFRLDISVNYLLTFWPLGHFGHSSHSCIKTCRNSAHQPIFSYILTEMT